MTDTELDRVLANALDVEPRADFLARVRTDVARQPAPLAWPGWWRAAAAGAVLAAATLGIYRAGIGDQAPAPDPARNAPLVATRTEPAPPAVARVASDPSPALVVRRAVRAVPSALPAPQISPEDADGLRLTLAGANSGIFAPITARDAHAPLTVSGIELMPIEVMPLAQMTPVDSGERQ